MYKIEFKSGKLLNKDSQDTTISEALQTIYNDGEIRFDWNDCKIVISLKNDVSDSWEDILEMISKLESGEKKFNMQWPSQTYWVLWKFVEINNTELEIYSSQEITKGSILRVKKNEFLKEWKNIINIIKNDLIKAGYNIFNTR